MTEAEKGSDRFWPRLWSSLKARLFILLLAGLCLSAALAEFIAPYDYHSQYRDTISQPPTRVHFFDAAGRFHLSPFIYKREPAPGQGHQDTLKQQRVAIKFLVRGDAYKLSGMIPGSIHLFGSEPGQGVRIHLLGTDPLGRDVFSRLVYGSRVTLSISLASLTVALLVGLLVGCIAGYFGGNVDALLMRAGELIQSVPAIFLILALRAAFPLEVSFEKTLTMLVAIFGFASWPEVSRLVRSNVLSLRGKEFMLSAKAVGARNGWIIWHHVLPNTLTPAIVQAAIIVPAFILAEAALSFLGVGIQEPRPSWGNMLAAAQDLGVLTSSWWMLTPGVAIFITVAMFNTLGDAVRDALDPRMRTLSQGWG